MTDVFSEQKRAEIMSRIKGKHTRPERIVRSVLHGMGYRFRLHVADLPGKPDIVLPRHKTVVFVNGCFWHGHRHCRKGRLPETNVDFWREKIKGNILRDRRAARRLRAAGWHVLTVWECQTGDVPKLTARLQALLKR